RRWTAGFGARTGNPAFANKRAGGGFPISTGPVSPMVEISSAEFKGRGNFGLEPYPHPPKPPQGEQREPHKHQKTSLYAFEQLDPGLLQLVAAYACGHDRPNLVEIRLQEFVAERTHRESCNIAMLEQCRFIFYQGDRAMQRMGMATQHPQLGTGSGTIS